MIASLLILSLPVLQDPGQAEILSETTLELPYLGLEVVDIRLLDREAGTIRQITTLPDGTPVDIRDLRRRERQAAAANGGKVSHELRERIEGMDAAEPVHVVFWLKCDDSPDFRVILQDAWDRGMSVKDARILARDTAEAFFAPRIAAFAEQLAAAGHQVTQTGGPWPIVYAFVPAGEVDAWALDPGVDMVYFVFPYSEHELVNAQGTMRTNNLWDRGLTGAGSPVKVMVNDPGHVTQSNPDLPPVVWIHGSGGVASHASGVAGNICFNHAIYKGAAYGIPQIYSADGTGDTGAPPAWNTAVNQGIDFGNCSWWNFNKGAIVFLDRFFDYHLRNFSQMMFKSTGNQGTTGTPYTTTPGNAYNVTCSGAYNDADNVNWSDDAMASYSSYWDPVEGHEKPELANAGDGVTTAGTSTTQGFAGTSSASPLTAGAATLMATQDNSLTGAPQGVKAILMVSAWHNIEGSALLSEYDGAGAVHSLAAVNVVRDGQFESGILTAASFNASGNYEKTFTAYKDDETRVIALWQSKADSGATMDLVEMDLDMVILDPSMAPVASSASSVNPFEIASFIPAVTGTYTIRLTRQRFDGTSEPYTIAWSSRMDMAQGTVAVSGSTKVGGTLNLDFDDRYQSNVYYAAFASFKSLPNVVKVGPGWVLPLKQDKAFNFTSGKAGFTGTLNTLGHASTSVQIPNRSGLIGKTTYLSFFTKPNAGSATINGTAEVASFVVQP